MVIIMDISVKMEIWQKEIQKSGKGKGTYYFK